MTPEHHRKIIHIDMDAFFAAIEQRDFPQYRNKPVVVGGVPNSRGVVATCSYEARRYGIHSAMPSTHAYRLCPQAVFIMPRFDVYKEASVQIRQIFAGYTDLVEPLSLDEAYLDVSDVAVLQGSATLIAKAIKEKIKQQVGLIASAGVSYNKFLAKMASDRDKPDGFYLITQSKGLNLPNNCQLVNFTALVR
jgi:DNA polymerase-4